MTTTATSTTMTTENSLQRERTYFLHDTIPLDTVTDSHISGSEWDDYSGDSDSVPVVEECMNINDYVINSSVQPTEVLINKQNRSIDVRHTNRKELEGSSLGSRFKLLEAVVILLPKLELPIDVATTGYIELLPEFELEDYVLGDGWCKDLAGRIVFVYEETLYFQRYQGGEVIMYGHLSKACFSNMLGESGATELLSNIQKRCFVC